MKFSAINFPCSGCGASLIYSPELGKMTCLFCGSEAEIAASTLQTTADDYLATLASLPKKLDEAVSKEVSCKKCGGSFSFSEKLFASHCTYCNTPAVIDCIQDITPKALLPFAISQKKAQEKFKIWVGSRWFAPNAFKAYLDESKKLVGYYFPYWTYDTQTVSRYNGYRGDAYYVTVYKRVQGEEKEVQERRIEWTPANGVIDVSFEDITVGASHTIERSRLDDIEPWSTQELVDFDSQYISGFEAEEYALSLQDGFDIAKRKMESTIQYRVKADIGGDEQRVDYIDTQYLDIGYKAVLFPVWVASFVWNDKTYNYAINARTGKIVGERPYSYVKIAFAILGAVVVAGGIWYFTRP
jgi:hypothetical protein